MSSYVKKINKAVIEGKTYKPSTPTNEEIQKYGCCLSIKKTQSGEKSKTCLQNNYPEIITNNMFYNT
ncbi:m18L [Myxoma virus]|uniref:M18L n=3 Tax=Myxoma virus TaxID=10273 RepID=A0A481N8W4_9POXV|nr:m18L [Myxoma virus]QAV38387.1 m18L [Myxoma virus]QAV38894.1 m18L [Myxoma virus]QAV39401.1 m18L [Myxoma virus]QAV39570.1 m18L [Myxoma virus]